MQGTPRGTPVTYLKVTALTVSPSDRFLRQIPTLSDMDGGRKLTCITGDLAGLQASKIHFVSVGNTICDILYVWLYLSYHVSGNVEKVFKGACTCIEVNQRSVREVGSHAKLYNSAQSLSSILVCVSSNKVLTFCKCIGAVVLYSSPSLLLFDRTRINILRYCLLLSGLFQCHQTVTQPSLCTQYPAMNLVTVTTRLPPGYSSLHLSGCCPMYIDLELWSL